MRGESYNWIKNWGANYSAQRLSEENKNKR